MRKIKWLLIAGWSMSLFFPINSTTPRSRTGCSRWYITPKSGTSDKISFLSSGLGLAEMFDPVTRLMQVRIEIRNPDNRLRPEMLASASSQPEQASPLSSYRRRRFNRSTARMSSLYAWRRIGSKYIRYKQTKTFAATSASLRG